MIDHSKLSAKPETEDFRHKYETNKAGQKLIDGYFKAVKRLLKTPLKSNNKMKALEIGCGEGYSTKRLRDMLPIHVELEASEFVEAQIPEAKKINPDLRITAESVYDLKRSDNSLDIVFLLEVLEHLDYPEKALEEISRVVRPDGYLILGVPREPLWRVINMARGKYLKNFGNTTGHLNHWSKKSLIKHVEQNFHQVINVESPLPWTIVLARKTTNSRSKK